MKVSNYKALLKSVGVFAAGVLGVAVFLYPFPGECYECPILQRLSGLLFSVLGVTVFFLPPVIIMVLFFWKKEKIRKYIKLSLLLWLPVLLNLALLCDLFEIKTNIGGIARWIFTYAQEHKIDFILLFLPIIGIDLLILHLLGIDILALFRRMLNEFKGFFASKDEKKEATGDKETSTTDK